MPRNVRNFWLTLEVDGKAKPVEAGPKAAGGGFTLAVRQRNAGAVTVAGYLTGHVLSDGRLLLQWEPREPAESRGRIRTLHTTQR